MLYLKETCVTKSGKSLWQRKRQCCRSGSVGSVCFWASWIRIHQLEVWIRISILLSSSKIVLFYFLSFKNDVNVTSKSNKQRNFFWKLVFCWPLEGQWRKKQDPDPLVRGMDPRIHTTAKWHGSATLVRGHTLMTCRLSKDSLSFSIYDRSPRNVLSI